MLAAASFSRMQAIVQDRYGSSKNLRLSEVETPTPDASSVLLKVRSASINGLDWRLLAGRPAILRLLGFGLARPKRRIRGVDVAGEVIAVPSSGARFRVGDAVFGLGSGSFAEYVAADQGEITAKPDTVSFDDAATLGVAACTALQGLRDWGHVRPGQSVAVTGAGSGVGSFAVQLAKWMGARVTAVTTSENVDWLRSAGADAVVDYRTEDFTLRSDRYDVILDISGLNSMGALLRSLRPGGCLVVIGGRGTFGPLIAAGLRRRLLRQPVHAFFAKVHADDLAQLGELVAQQKIRPVIDHVYSLAETPQAMARAEAHRTRGKLVIHVA
jgi:NADPH:quinone reductase-like Zn-dependent oxidoreductase